ncbi:MAG: inverse autotransporter beta domain-containing protein [Gammaproteobacteria bacterium]|nr:inverse autotransporter beta domain-containing protein [Gammaproteobacteria bacterium]
MAHAGTSERVWQQSGSIVNECATQLGSGAGHGVACILGGGLNLLIDEGLLYANQSGKKLFGEHFQVVGSLGWSSASFGTGFSGFEADLDVVAPLAAYGPSDHGGFEQSLFFQQGITRWWDSYGTARNDVRYGVVRRFRVSSAPDADIVGLSALFQHSLELGHQVAVPSVDYIGRWGAGSLRYFVPTTGWRRAHAGREERALEGMELGLRLDLTTTFGLNGTAYQWEAEDGSGRTSHGGRLGFNWRPHPWLAFDAGYDSVRERNDVASLGMRVVVPLGPTEHRPRWSGLGVADGGNGVSSEQLWQPVEEIGQIRVAERASSEPAAETEVTARFVQEDFGSGETVAIEVSLSRPAAHDVGVVVRLVPGAGSNAAVPGEDFVDEPVTATIREGTRSAIVSITLLLNQSMEQPRSLGVTASLAS